MSKIEINNVYKIFGNNPQSVMPMVKDGANKEEVLEQTGHTVGLDNVSLKIEEGETFVCMGLSGSGKSTLIRHLNRLIDPTDGEILVEGTNVMSLNKEQLIEFRRHKMSMVFQRFGLFPHKTVLQNVGYGLEMQGKAEEERHSVAMEEIDAVVAKKIGSIIRGSGRLIKQSNGKKMRIKGMIPEIQGMGVTLESHSISQVSMNILDVNTCPIHKAFEICKSIANDHNTKLRGSELVGLVPLNSMLEAGRWYGNRDNLSEDELVAAAIDGLGLSELEEFNPRKRIIEWALRGD